MAEWDTCTVERGLAKEKKQTASLEITESLSSREVLEYLQHGVSITNESGTVIYWNSFPGTNHRIKVQRCSEFTHMGCSVHDAAQGEKDQGRIHVFQVGDAEIVKNREIALA